MRLLRSVILNGAAAIGLGMAGYGLWMLGRPVFWIVAGVVLFGGSLYLCLALKDRNDT